MKKIIIILWLICGVFVDAHAQSSTQRMKAVHMSAVRIADRLGIQEPKRSEFINIYQAFKKESSAVLSVNPASTGDREKDIEAKITTDFEKSEKILTIRIAYYKKFRTILLPSQIQAMYDIEKEFKAAKQ